LRHGARLRRHDDQHLHVADPTLARQRGLDERWKFLLKQAARRVGGAPGRTAINHAVPMRPDGTMIEQLEGPYSWNRFDPRLNSAWMREWPESFVRLA
jgi:hypothetical protein